MNINKGDEKEQVENNKALKPFAINYVMENHCAPGTTVALIRGACLVVRQQADRLVSSQKSMKCKVS